MRKKYLDQVFFCFFLIITLFSCTKEQDDGSKCFSITKAPVTKIEGANSATINQEIILTISFGCSNGCGQFGNFDEVTSGNVTMITVNAKYEGCICTHDIPTRQITYKFKKSQPGIFDLKFSQLGNTYLQHTIIVQ